LISYSVVLSRVPQHDKSIRSAMIRHNDPSLIGRAARIPFHEESGGCISRLIWFRGSFLPIAKIERGFKGEFQFLPTFCGQAFSLSEEVDLVALEG